MFLKSLDIFGFKSFADKTRIEFADGITTLLGPNGCGKSNVVDAVKWALGEQASRAMRAEKMEDVIFNGTEDRKPLNVAEVILTLGNDTGLLPLDVPEIEVKRRLFRSGESEYFINSAPVRLKEIRELFWDTGVGKVAYSVMEQGKIDQILSSKPEERRYLFEEAAGITKFRIRSAEAERKLAKTEENIRQVEGILGEVKRSYETLRIQSEKTLKYRALRDEIFQYELDIQLLKLKNFRNERDAKQELLRKKTIERDALKEDIEAANKALEENMDLVNSLHARLAEYQKNIYGLAVEKTAREKEVRLLSEQRSDSQAKITMNEGREKAAAFKIEELVQDAHEQDEEVRIFQKKVHDIEENISSFEANIQLTSASIGENEGLVRKSEEEIQLLEKERAEREGDLEAITDDIVAALDAGLKEAGYSAAERRNSEASLHENLLFLKTTLAGREALIRDLSQAAERAISAGTPPPPEEIKRLAEGLAASLAEAAGRADRTLSLFEAYRKSTPSFLDEFLAPEGIITRKRALDAKIRSCRDGVLEKRGFIADLRKRNEDLGAKINEYRSTLEDLRVNRMKMTTQAEAAEEVARLIRRELANQENLIKNIQDELFLDRKRFAEIDGRIQDAETEIVEIEQRGKQLTEDLEKVEQDISVKNTDVAGSQDSIRKRMTEMAKVQENLEKLHLELVQSETEIKNIGDNFRESHSRDLMEYEERIYTITAQSGELREHLARCRQALKDLGAVNFAAPEEFSETKERFDFLSGQLADLARARTDLEQLNTELRTESSLLFMATYDKIKKNFHNMFRRLFGGGRAELRLLDLNHVLESGIEIFAQPPGKKLENINLLSGGERSMTAVALLFATYLVKPSPFCLLDEIDAALDDENVGRFGQILREFGSKSQFIVITHNKRTITCANTLLGVTMEESGVSKLISVRLDHEEEERYVPEPYQDELFEEEEVELESGRELPPGINDPSKVSEADLRPIRSRRRAEA
ncbi:MAG: AAA family ATPase [Treponema sp.]|nr:AAA family ATPase [Treponema sp.]